MSLRLSGCILLICTSALPANEDADFLHTCLARKALADDAQISLANVGVRVTNRVVTLWGPVPSAALAQRAHAILKARPEFVEVRNELVVIPEDDPWAVPVTKLDHASPRSSGVLAGRIENERPAVLKHTEPVKPLQQRLREWRESRPQYQAFSASVEGAIILVTAPLDAGETLQDFLREVSRLPGVERVILKN